jgi:hypothetical protein
MHVAPMIRENSPQNDTTSTKSEVIEETAQSAFSGYEVGLSKLAWVYLG